MEGLDDGASDGRRVPVLEARILLISESNDFDLPGEFRSFPVRMIRIPSNLPPFDIRRFMLDEAALDGRRFPACRSCEGLDGRR